MALTAFVPSPAVFIRRQGALSPSGLRRPGRAHGTLARRRVVCQQHAGQEAPPIGLVPSAGTTGSCAANLWPIPILGSYGWTLIVWKRTDLVGWSTCAHVHDAGATSLALSILPRTAAPGIASETIPGVVTGDYNVARALRNLSATPDDGYRLQFLDHPSNNFLSLKSELSIAERPGSAQSYSQFWSCASQEYQRVSKVNDSAPNSFQILKVYEKPVKTPPRSKFQFFAMSLAPIPILGPYSCFVAVNRQHRNANHWTALDKRDKSVNLSLVDWGASQDVEVDESRFVSHVALQEFRGPVTDAKAARAHQDLLNALTDTGHQAASGTRFRILMENKPHVSMTSRLNAVVVELTNFGPS